MRIHTLEHVPFEGPAAIGEWAQANGHSLSRTPVYADGPLPGPEDFDFLAVLGGPMSVHDESEHPWLMAEKALLRRAVESGKPMLGVCLGAQLFAEALGGEVTRNPEPEIGWLTVEATGTGAGCPLFQGMPDSFTAFHWHGDTFSIPPGAVHLARSQACANQAFSFENRILGVQFHLETTPDSMKLLIDNCADEIVDAPFVQDAERMRSRVDYCDTIRPTLDILLNNLTKEY